MPFGASGFKSLPRRLYNIMAIIKTEEKEIYLDDYTDIQAACRSLGVPFNCEKGTCGTCRINILKGEENLAPKNRQEQRFPLEKHERLACQATIDQGILEIRF